MRITNNTLVRTFLSNVNNNLNKMAKYQDQMSSGKEIRRPSDDPFAVVRSMGYNTSLRRNDQYLKNIENAIGWLNTTDTALGQIGSSLDRIRVLMLDAASGTKTQTELDAIKNEIVQRIEEVVQTGNTTFDDKYIFGGDITTKKPFESDKNGTITGYTTDTGTIYREISPGVDLDINITASDVMKTEHLNEKTDVYEDIDLGETLTLIKDALENGKTSEVSGELLGKITSHIDNVLKIRGEVGAKYNRMESAKYKNEEESFNMTEILSKIEDIDLAEKIMEYSVMETVYQASLMTNAKILQPSLVDFLR